MLAEKGLPAPLCCCPLMGMDHSSHPLLVAYFPIRDPLVPIERLDIYEEVGVNIVELGLKAANPVMDGEIIANSMQRSTGQGQVADALLAAERIREFRHEALGILFCYPEPQLLATTGDWAGIDAVLCAPTDIKAQDRINSMARAMGSRIAEAVPCDADETDFERAKRADAYVMVQYSRGKTGLRRTRDETLGQRIDDLRQAGISVPIVAGIGISEPEQAKDAISQGADGIVVGSKPVAMAEQSAYALADYLSKMRETIDRV